MTDKFELHPHMTLIKVNRPIARFRKSKYLPSALYESHVNDHFGIQPVDNLQLCILESTTRFDGFYSTLTEMKFWKNIFCCDEKFFRANFHLGGKYQIIQMIHHEIWHIFLRVFLLAKSIFYNWQILCTYNDFLKCFFFVQGPFSFETIVSKDAWNKTKRYY